MVPLVSLPKGYAGLMYLQTFATQTVPAGNNYIEGCWHLFTHADATAAPWPGVVLGTGVEDFFGEQIDLLSIVLLYNLDNVIPPSPLPHVHACNGRSSQQPAAKHAAWSVECQKLLV